MLQRNLPPIGARYWIVISIASVFGANMGDFVSHDLYLGHVRGLPFLAFLFAILLLAEQRRVIAGEACYWLAIVILRTAATNLSDLATHDLELPYGWVIAGLGVLLTLLLMLRPTKLPAAGLSALPSTDGWYWAAMLTAGVLGTAVGDCTADALGLGTGLGSVVLGAILVITLGLGSRTGWTTSSAYWSGIVAVRSAGTTAGDFLVDRDGIGLGLPLSTACMGVLLIATIGLWRQRPVAGLRRL